MEMKNLELFDSRKNSFGESVCANTITFRKAVMAKELPEYKRKLSQLRSLEKKLIKAETEIYGVMGKINLGLVKARCSARGMIEIDPEAKQITINEHLSEQYGNGCILRQEQIVPHNFDIQNFSVFNDDVIITLRRLALKKENELKAEYDKNYKKAKAKLEKGDEDEVLTILKSKPRRSEPSLRTALNEVSTVLKSKPIYAPEWYIRENANDQKEVDSFFSKLIRNIDFLSFFFASEALDVKAAYEEFSYVFKAFEKFTSMPSNSPFISKGKEIFRWSYFDVTSESPSLKEAKYVIDTVRREIEEANSLLTSTDYEQMKNEYYALCQEVESLEAKILR